jgi:phosphate/sulfate permease
LLGYDLKGEIHINLPDGTMMLLFSDPARFWEVFWEALGPIILPMMVGAIPLGGAVAVALYFLVYKAVASYQEHRRHLLSERRRQLEQLAE